MRTVSFCLAVLIAGCSPKDSAPVVTDRVESGVTSLLQSDVKEGPIITDAVERHGSIGRQGSCLILVHDGRKYAPVFTNLMGMRSALQIASTTPSASLELHGAPIARVQRDNGNEVTAFCGQPLFLLRGVTPSDLGRRRDVPDQPPRPGLGGASDVTQQSSASSSVAEPGVRLFTFVQAKAQPGQPAPTYHQVAVSGRLGVRNGCLVLDTSEGRQLALVFGEGTAAFDQARNTLMVDGRPFAVGSTVSMGGSGGSAVESMPQGDPKEQCGADDTWTVVPGSIKPAG